MSQKKTENKDHAQVYGTPMTFARRTRWSSYYLLQKYVEVARSNPWPRIDKLSQFHFHNGDI